MDKAVFVWSAGKDSALALHRVLLEKQYQVNYLLTTVNEKYQRISMHGVRIALLEKQAAALNIPLLQVQIPENASMDDYEKNMHAAFLNLKEKGIETAIFGDIFLEDLRTYREKQLASVGLKPYFPLWQEDTTKLIHEFEDLGFQAKLICVSDARLGEKFVGSQINRELLNNLPAGVDPCGENGEYHSFVYDGPIFKNPILFQEGELILKDYAAKESDDSTPPAYDSKFWFLDLLPV